MKSEAIIEMVRAVVPLGYRGRNTRRFALGFPGAKDAVDEIVDKILKPLVPCGHVAPSLTRLCACYGGRMRAGSLFCREGTVRRVPR